MQPTSDVASAKGEFLATEGQGAVYGGEWLWATWSGLSAHDKKAVVAFFASIFRPELQVGTHGQCAG